MAISTIVFLMAIIAILFVIFIFSKIKKKNKVLLAIAIFISIVIVGIKMYYPTYVWYSFSLIKNVKSGITKIPFKVPLFTSLKGGYSIAIENISDTGTVFSVSGYVRDMKIDGERYLFKGHIEDKEQHTLALGVNIIQDIKREGVVVIDIKSDDPEAEYRFFIGRNFP